jgi:hypothetical protein
MQEGQEEINDLWGMVGDGKQISNTWINGELILEPLWKDKTGELEGKAQCLLIHWLP